MPSAALQSRINAFESLATAARNIPTRPSSFLETPLSPSPSTSLDLKDWVLDDGHETVLINLESPKKAPPLPPRKPSLTSLKIKSPPPLPTRHSDSLTVEHTYPPSQSEKAKNGHAPASSISSLHSVSLSSDPDTPSTTTTFSNHIATFPVDRLSSNGSEASLDESFENVSNSAVGSPTTAAIISQDWEKAMERRKPPLPKRPSKPSSPNSSYPPSPQTKSSSRKIPPPVSRSSTSDRSSVLSAGSTSTGSRRPVPNLSLARPTPIPPAARKRYENLFNANVIQKRKADKQKPALLNPDTARKTRQAAGWRGVSIDLTTSDEPPTVNEDDWIADGDELVIGPSERLDGYVIRHIWSRSRLDKSKLADIWYDSIFISPSSHTHSLLGMTVIRRRREVWTVMAL